VPFICQEKKRNTQKTISPVIALSTLKTSHVDAIACDRFFPGKICLPIFSAQNTLTQTENLRRSRRVMSDDSEKAFRTML
jgi:hypothetical protein